MEVNYNIDVNVSWRYGVFLHCGGADIGGRNFTHHLNRLLALKRINTFVDDNDDDDGLRRGDDQISAALVKKLEGSRISIIVFSKKYASSSRCLDKLVKILEYRAASNGEMIVMPIFYKVDSSDVGDQTGAFADAFAAHDYDKENAIRWRKALKEAANLDDGWHLKTNNYYTILIHKVVEEISARIEKRTYMYMPEWTVGLKSRVGEIIKILGVGANDDVRMVGIWGMVGIGKTTVAKAVYNSVAHIFEACCFLENIRQKSILSLQHNLFYQILKRAGIEVSNVSQGIKLIRRQLRNKRTLVILDDLDELEQLDKLMGGSADWLGLGSRIIITTRDKSLLTACGVNLIHKVKELDFAEALELFTWNAFKNHKLPDDDDYVQLAAKAVRYAGGLPCAITAIASFLLDRSMHEWRSALQRLEIFPASKKILETLKTSYDALEDISAEWCFLMANLFLEILSISFDQASSPRNPHFALYGMVLAFGAVLISISELIYKGRRERVRLRRWWKLWWFHHPHSRYALFGTLPDFYGLIGGISQSILSTFQYVRIIRKVANPIKVSLWPAIFVICVIASRLAKKSIQANERND